ncbi:MAG: NUDIX hydrolase [Candidatus Micrarchaeota archaeon]
MFLKERKITKKNSLLFGKKLLTNEMRTEKRVQIIIFNNQRILLAKRKDRIKTRFYWRLPKGGVDDNETLEETLKRELREETGITQASEPKQVYYYEVKGKHAQNVTSFFVETKQNAELTLDAMDEGIIEVQWFPPEEALKKLFFKEEKQAIKEALKQKLS